MELNERSALVELKSKRDQLVPMIRAAAEVERIDDIQNPPLDPLVGRIGDARVVLLGEATHGTSEFYDIRGALTLKLIKEKGFNFVALEADWPDVEQVNDYIHGWREAWGGFNRFPEWMWRNQSFACFVEGLKIHNASERHPPASIYGLDLYSLAASLREVMRFLESHDPSAAATARHAFECLHPWQFEPSRYGLAVWRNLIQSCEGEVLELLKMLHERRMDRLRAGQEEIFSALQNARVLRSAEEYYRSMYKGSVASWNLRDGHMFDMLETLLDHFGPDSKAIVWEHNSHIGNAAATEMGWAGEHNVGQLARQKLGDDVYAIGFLTDHGTVAAASAWDGEMEIKNVRPARPDSYESLLNQTGVPAFFLPLRDQTTQLRKQLQAPLLERAIGVLYLPETERSSHYFEARLAKQFDEICWVGETHALTPLAHVPETEEPDTYPFGV